MRRIPLFRAADPDSLGLLPERKLYWAILARTAKDAAGLGTLADGNARAGLQEEARAWIHSNKLEAFSFAHICEELDLDRETVRRRLLSEDVAERLNDGRLNLVNYSVFDKQQMEAA
jgi:hypothetical protein